MKKLKLQMQMSLDGFVARNDGNLDWMAREMDPRQLAELQDLTDSMDTILLGRKMTGGFTGYWENVVNNQPDSPEFPYAKIFVDTPKIVFSKSLDKMDGKNLKVEKGDLSETVNKLKNETGKDIIVYGGAGFAAELLNHRLIDEINLFISPIAIGQGLRLFSADYRLELLKSDAYSNGVVFHRYRPVL